MAKKKTKIPAKAIGIGAAVLLGIGLLSGGEDESAPEPTAEPVRAAAFVETTDPPPGTPEPTATPYRIHFHDPQTVVYVSKQGVIHFDKNCSGMQHCTEMTLEAADAAGYKYCSRCG